ncbi:ABC transporter permease [Chryseolinea sp. T2]|uniref:ABC transporter permease n=1 Tax=Chryseolinea sp. T2 TaxID=3129255 RepID=UPI003077C920
MKDSPNKSDHPSQKTSPPKWPLNLLRLFIRKEYLEEIEGDMEELFHEWAAQRGSYARARRQYIWETLRLARPILMKHFSLTRLRNPSPMFTNYYKTSFRSLTRHPLTAFINVFGLSVAIGICLLVYSFMAYDQRIDQFHENKSSIYLATFNASRDGNAQQYGLTPRPLGEALKHDLPQVKEVCRIDESNIVLKYRDNVFHERVRYVDPSFLQMFTFPLKWGVASSLTDLNSLVMSEDMSTKYFGDENPVGQTMTMIFSDSIKKDFIVAGVASEFPKERDLDFGLLINYDNLKTASAAFKPDDWSQFLRATWVQIETKDLNAVNDQMKKYQTIQHAALPEWNITSFKLEPLTSLHERSSGIRDAIVQDFNVEGRIGMPIIAIFMIVLACFNYINIAIVSAAKRLKEIGVRKVIGANRLRVIFQFLTENIFVTLFALMIGVALCYFIFMPWFVQFTGWPLELNFLNKGIWMFLIGLVLFTGVVSGIYPAFYISQFDAVRIFKGSLQFGRKNPLTRIFLGVQIVLACMTITAGVVLTQNNRFQHERSWGYNQKDMLYVKVPNRQAYDRMQAAMISHPDVVAVTGSADHVGKAATTSIIRTSTNQQLETDRFAVDGNYLETMGLQLLQGASLREDSESDAHAVLVNELLVKELGLKSPIGEYFTIDSVRYEVTGIVKDFHSRDFFSKVRPAVFTKAPKEDYHFLTMRLRAGADNNALQSLQKQWASLYPEIPFQGGHQQDVWTSYFESVDRSQEFTNVVAAVAVLLASLGLYGLVTLNVSGRVKEFSIRKTLGAGLSGISGVIMKQYLALTLVSMTLGIPASYLFTKAYLNMLFAYPMPMDYSGSLIAVVILIGVLLMVISTQIRKVLKLNPVEGLKADQG